MTPLLQQILTWQHPVHGQVDHFWSSYGWNLAMDQYLLIPFLGGWTSIYQLFWCSPGVQGFDTLPFQANRNQKPLWHVEARGIGSSGAPLPVDRSSTAGELRFVRPGDEMDAAGNLFASLQNSLHELMNSSCSQCPRGKVYQIFRDGLIGRWLSILLGGSCNWYTHWNRCIAIYIYKQNITELCLYDLIYG